MAAKLDVVLETRKERDLQDLCGMEKAFQQFAFGLARRCPSLRRFLVILVRSLSTISFEPNAPEAKAKAKRQVKEFHLRGQMGVSVILCPGNQSRNEGKALGGKMTVGE